MLARLKRWLSGVKPKWRGEEISILPPLDPARPRVRPRPGVSGPNYRRTAEVYAVLAVAPPHLTYGQLIRRVRVATGRACSRKLVARWKRERRSLASPPQAAPPIAIAALTAVMLCHVSACSSVSRPAPSPAPTPSPSAIVVGADDSPAGPRGGGAPRHLKITLTVTSPSDLRVKAGDRVEAGAVLVDRGQERPARRPAPPAPALDAKAAGAGHPRRRITPAHRAARREPPAGEFRGRGGGNRPGCD